jgi:hypothetical protein
MRREEALEQRTGIDRPGSRDDLQELAEPGEQQQGERNGGQQALERKGAGEKRDVVLIGGL